MAIGRIKDDIDHLPKAMLPPQTYGDLYVMDALIDQQFPFAREAALRGNSGDRIRKIHMALKNAFWSQCAPSEPLAETAQKLGIEALSLMNILDTSDFDPKIPGALDTIINTMRRAAHMASKNIPSL